MTKATAQMGGLTREDVASMKATGCDSRWSRKQKDALCDLALQAFDRWVPVSERLPKDETPVLILRNGDLDIGEIRWDMPGFEDTYKAFRYWDNPNNDGQAWEWNDITHWMPLPPPPERP